MIPTKRSLSRLSIVAVVFLSLIGLGVLISGQEAPTNRMGLIDDWTHHHLVFSNPGTAPDALAQGRIAEWYRIVNDPRYNMQQMKRNPMQQAMEPAPDFATLTARLSAPVRRPQPIGPAPVRILRQPLGRDWSMNLGGAAASQTGTFTASSGTGTVVVNSVTLTASPGTAASQSTTISSNGVHSGNTITIYNPLNSSTLQLIANTPVAQVGQFAFGGSAPAVGAYDKIATIYYYFATSGWTSVPATSCNINNGGTTAQMVSWLASAITYGSANTGASTSTWQCNASGATQPSNGVTVTSSTSPNVVVTAKIAGSTGFSKTVSGTNAPTFSVLTAGSDGSSTSPYFQWWSGAAAVSNTQLATNIYTAITTGTVVGVTATNPSGQVVLTASLKGLAGRNINVATTITSGLTGAAFNGNLTGGTAGTTSGATFSTSTDSTTQSTNLANEAAALASAIITSVSALTASSAGAVVTVTDKTAGTGGNSIALSGTVGSTFSWAGGTLGGGSTPGTVGAGMYPAKFSFSTTTASCTDFVVYNTGIAGSASQANVVAYDNIYSGCSGSGTVPSVYWAYNTGTGKALTSTVLFGDGTKVAFIENPSSGAAVLRILKWVSGQGTDSDSPVAPDHSYTNTYAGAGTNTAWTTCPSGSCMISVAFQSPRANQDTISSPWYDYPSDTLWVGDSGGYLHKFTGVFNGTPGEMTNTSGGTCGTSCVWPVNSGTGPLTSPVYDSTHALLFLGNFAGKLASVSSSSGAVVSSGVIASGGPDISDPRIAIDGGGKPQKRRSPSRDVCYRDFVRNPRPTPGG